METLPIWLLAAIKAIVLIVAWIIIGIPIAFIAGLPFDQGIGMSRHTPEPGSDEAIRWDKKMGRAGTAGIIAFIGWGIFLLCIGMGWIK